MRGSSDRGGPGAGVAEGEPLLRVTDVVAGYGGGDILRGVSLEVTKGAVTCVVGPNGAGKSTLMAVITGLLRPRRGQITLGGSSLVGKAPPDILGMGVSYVPQTHSIFPRMTVQENLDMGGFLLRDRRMVAQRRDRMLDTFPVLAQCAAKKAASLSGGQQRALEFARGLMLDPTLVILDEPSMGLDPVALEVVWETIETMHADGRSILLVEQNVTAGLGLASHGVVLESGRVRLSGPAGAVLEHPEIAELYLGGVQSGSSQD